MFLEYLFFLLIWEYQFSALFFLWVVTIDTITTVYKGPIMLPFLMQVFFTDLRLHKGYLHEKVLQDRALNLP